ncbi:O-methyltransferase [Kibdelosporangium persicum]|uniref:O-methyltransferase YrrM n=1 Tax=Kibdelosporangium persicum TaxID=2698649 RepID=A0ABX2F123_9PSEU|nr:class I SAM-dependent methyltransferase [Kibdelosporangium persicum]NRN64923.1 putative O-methyltransferase YrrM [Kibdelosporangium persicum]
MTNSLAKAQVRAVLDRLFSAAAEDAWPQSYPTDPQAHADALAEVYMPISADGGKLLYSLVRSARPETVVEFGTSFGISTIHLAAAVADNGKGHVYGSEMNAAKREAAQANLNEAGLAGQVTVLPGDARESFADIRGPIGLVLLDGWKDLCLPVLQSLEPKLEPGALVVADDVSFATMSDYLGYVRDPANGYVSVEFPVEDGMEVSCYTGA